MRNTMVKSAQRQVYLRSYIPNNFTYVAYLRADLNSKDLLLFKLLQVIVNKKYVYQ